MKIKPGKNQVTWAITLFILCVSLMLAYYVIFDGKTIITNISRIIDSLSGINIGIVLAFILIPLLEGIEHRILIPIWRKSPENIKWRICCILRIYTRWTVFSRHWVKCIIAIRYSSPPYWKFRKYIGIISMHHIVMHRASNTKSIVYYNRFFEKYLI